MEDNYPADPVIVRLMLEIAAELEAEASPDMSLLSVGEAADRSRATEALDVAARAREAAAPSVDRAKEGEPERRLGAPDPADITDEGAKLMVLNAGIVLAGPYLPQLFERLELAVRDPGGRLVWEKGAAERAVHVVQYLADGRCDAPEPFLALNKLLCGFDPAVPALASIALDAEQRAVCDSLLGSLVENWPMLRGSSTAALRETFFEREGLLVRVEAGWKLEVERKVLDVLLDSIPWSYSVIALPWMSEPLTVSW